MEQDRPGFEGVGSEGGRWRGGLPTAAIERRLSRRELIGLAARLGISTVGLGTVLEACSTAKPSAASSSTSSSSTSAARPRRGGTLTGGISGGSSDDTLDGQDPVTNADFARVNSLFQPLAGMDTSAQLKLVLAESLEPNSDATSWIVRLKPGITFHNGKDLTADDVIFSFQREVNPKDPMPGASGLVPVDVAGMKKLDSLTVQIPCHTPFSTFTETIAQVGYGNIVPVGFDPKNPVGTGPFRYKSFTPGVQSTFVRYADYWESGLPYLDELVLTDVADETTQVSGLLSGQFNVVDLLSSSSMGSVRTGGARLLIAKGGGWTPFTLRVDLRPFSDVRVRQALRYIVDRPEMINLVFDGYGTLGNDLFSIWDPNYDHDLPQRVQDIPRAKHLLKAAGYENLSVQLVTADVAQGTVLAAQVFAQQAKAAGVNVQLDKVTVTDFYGSNYLKWPFAQDYWYYTYYLPQVSDATLPNAPFNECHFDDPRYSALYTDALRIVDATARRDIVHEMQQIEYDQGGYIIPYFPPVIDGYGASVHGLTPSNVGISLGNYDFSRVWIA